MSLEKPESFVFYESFYVAISALHDDRTELACYRALAEYGLFHRRPRKVPDVAKSLVSGFAYQIDAARRNRNELSDKMSKLAKKKKNPKKKTPASLKAANKAADKASLNVNANVNDNDNANVFLDGGEAAPAQAREKKKNSYGEFHNVWLTSEEYANLAYQLGTTWKQQLEKLSAYKQSHPKFASADDYATLKLWRTNEEMKAQAGAPEKDEDTQKREDMLDQAWDDAIEDLWKDAEKDDEKT